LPKKRKCDSKKDASASKVLAIPDACCLKNSIIESDFPESAFGDTIKWSIEKASEEKTVYQMG